MLPKDLQTYYELGGEEERLTKDKSHSIEFITSTKYIEKYLKSDDRILEVGAGTGSYSLYYAEKGYKVDSVELIQYNIDVFKTHIKDNMKINLRQGNAIDLSMYQDNTFDITLVLGPLYHLYNEVDKKKAIAEAVRVTKKDGYIFIAYLTHGSVILNWGLKKGNLLELKRTCDEEYRFRDIPEEIFSMFFVDEFESLMEEYDVEFIKNVATDGISNFAREMVNELSDEEFAIWLDYHLKTCERKDIQGYSSHMLYICRKGK
jgi:ubiquinone/menaquinone biosynthesis C-methylase UbiE